MTPERWKQIEETFAGALLVPSPQQTEWVAKVCGSDMELRREVEQLLKEDEKAAVEGFMTAPEPSKDTEAIDQTESWPRRRRRLGQNGPATRFDSGTDPLGDPGGFSKAAIVAGLRTQPISETESVVRARLRELPLIYILILVMATTWRCLLLGDNDRVLHVLDGCVIAALAGVIALVSSPRPISISRLRWLELGMIGMLAMRVAIVQYRIVLIFSRRDEPMMAQMSVKNIVLVTCVLIITYGLYVPKTWRRVAPVVVTLAALPFATLSMLCLTHPEAMGWLWEAWRINGTSRFLLFTFDAMILGIVAIGSTFGAYAITRLRRQVAEARELGQYRLRRQIGAGGMGEVYLAEHQLLKRPCALKLIRPGSVEDPRALARFEREVRLTATLSHPNTVEIYDYGRTEDGTYYYVMEYLPGLSLADLVERHGPLPPGRAIYLLRQVCLALREAHASGLIHRDIKPSNIFASRRGGMHDVAKLLDFGLVLPMARAGIPQLSGEGQVLGTPLFMSPEQAKGGVELDERSDIYSLGAVAYYLLTGQPPFDEEDGIRAMIAHARDPVVPPSQVYEGIPTDLERVVMRCLAKNKGDRYANANFLELALGDCECSACWGQESASAWWRNAEMSRCLEADRVT